MKTVSFFSAGVSSAVATKLMIDQIDTIIYTHIDDQHEDTLRFVKDCEQWFGKTVHIIQSHYINVENACLQAGGKGYVNGPSGAACTKRLKRDLRIDWQKNHQKEGLNFIWGIDFIERKRMGRIEKSMPMQNHIFPLVSKKLTKSDTHKILKASGIKRPKMYDLGYLNNNCIGCVKGGMGYWNKIRNDFPKVFEARAKMERVIDGTCIKGIYLDELRPEQGKNQPPVVEECGIFCETIRL